MALVLAQWKDFVTTKDPIVEGQVKGTREKAWIRRHARDLWLRKRPKPHHHCEEFAEASSVRLARAVGLRAAETHATTWTSAAGEECTGAIVKEFGEGQREQVIDGEQLIRRYDQAYDPTRKEQHTLDRVFNTLARAEEEFGVTDLQTTMAHILVFDSWIGNADRHQGNWSLILDDETRRVRMAPLYDTTACFMRELPTGRFTSESWTWEDLADYSERCGSGFGDGVRALSMREATLALSDRPEVAANAARWLASFAQGLRALPRYLKTVPARWFPPARRRSLEHLLAWRLAWLGGALRL